MSPASKAPAQAPPPALVRGVRHLLRPLVRLLLAHQVTHPVLASLLKAVYLEVAEEQAGGEGLPTASRVSLLTGLHRKDIKRLREEPRSDYEPPASVSLGARLLARWTGAREFQDGRGRPRALARSPEPGSRQASFDDLVASVSTDIRPRAVLDEWLRLGIVELDDDRVRLRADAFVPRRGLAEKAHYFGRNVHDHMAAGVHNLLEEGSPLLERSVHYDGLSPESADELAALAERLGMDALRRVDRRARALQKRDAKHGGAKLRTNFGIYFLRAPGRRGRGARRRD